MLLEAGASGLPAVAAAAGGALELVGDGRAGHLVPPDDARAFADALHSLARSERARARLGRAGRTLALERDWEGSFDELLDAYRSLVRDTTAAPGPAVAV